MPLMDPMAALSRDPDALLATIAKLSAEAAERDLKIARIEAEKSASDRRATEAEAREIIALAAAQAAEEKAAGVRDELTASRDELAAARDEVKRLCEIIDQFKRHRFGRSSEKLDPDQYELVLEELETALSRAEAGLEALVDKADEPGERKEKRRRRNNRGALPAHLERIEQVVDIQDKRCACCGGDLHVIGEDVSERLDVVPALFRVLVTRRGSVRSFV